jgi:hypothetical protein
MTDEKIYELADQFDDGLPEFVMSREAVIAFAQAVIEESRDTTTIKVPTVVWDKLKDVNTVTDLIKALKVAEEEE